jgi:1,4-dihydroxy-2-naphthoate octaprenyltransferase
MSAAGTADLATWLSASRPRTLPAAIAPVVIGTAMALADGGLHWGAALAALLGALLIQIGTNLANDYFDFVKGADTAARKGPRRATQAGLVSPATMWRATLITFGLAALVGLYLVARGGWPVVGIGVASILAGLLYTGGPMPYGYRGLGDLFVLVFFGPVAVAGTHYVQTLSFSPAAAIAGLGPGLISVAVLAVNNLRDIETDAVAGKRTLAVRFGPGFARWEHAGAIGLAALLPLGFWLAGLRGPAMALPLLMLPAAWPVIRTVFATRDGPVLNAALAGTGRLLVLYAVLFCAGWLM